MIGAMWILLAMIIVGVILYIGDAIYIRKQKNNQTPGDLTVQGNEEESDSAKRLMSSKAESDSKDGGESVCCGLHLVCEKDSLSPMSAEILYYDDEELDRFVGRDEKSYTPEEIEEFRDVLMTLRSEDVEGWARSVTQRGLPLPPEIKDELLILVNEKRGNSTNMKEGRG